MATPTDAATAMVDRQRWARDAVSTQRQDGGARAEIKRGNAPQSPSLTLSSMPDPLLQEWAPGRLRLLGPHESRPSAYLLNDRVAHGGIAIAIRLEHPPSSEHPFFGIYRAELWCENARCILMGRNELPPAPPPTACPHCGVPLVTRWCVFVTFHFVGRIFAAAFALLGVLASFPHHRHFVSCRGGPRGGPPAPQR